MLKQVETEETRLFCHIFINGSIAIGGGAGPLPPPSYAYATTDQLVAVSSRTKSENLATAIGTCRPRLPVLSVVATAGQGGPAPLTAACVPHLSLLGIMFLEHHVTTRQLTNDGKTNNNIQT